MGLSVSAKISLGFSIVLALHISIAVLGHYGLSKARRDLDTYDKLRLQVEKFSEIDRTVGALQRNVLLFAYTGYQGPEVRAMELQDRFGQSTQIVFENLRSGVVHNPATFKFEPPAGVDVYGVGG